MTARRTDEAIDALVSRARAVGACVSDRPIIATRSYSPNLSLSVAFAPIRQPVILRTARGDRSVLLWINEGYAIADTSHADPLLRLRKAEYYYNILDTDEREILAYHWHPAGRSTVTHPHLHLSSRVNPIDTGRGGEPLSLAELHLVTGLVALADVAHMLIEEFGVRPRRRGWRETLTGTDHERWQA